LTCLILLVSHWQKQWHNILFLTLLTVSLQVWKSNKILIQFKAGMEAVSSVSVQIVFCNVIGWCSITFYDSVNNVSPSPLSLKAQQGTFNHEMSSNNHCQFCWDQTINYAFAVDLSLQTSALITNYRNHSPLEDVSINNGSLL
jgi:hypothetical protein